MRYAGYSSCFRREAGAAGHDTRGIFRVHQFDKVEMFSFCRAGAERAEHRLILAAEEEILQGLGIPYQRRQHRRRRPGRPGGPEVRLRGLDARPGALPRGHQLHQLHATTRRGASTCRFRTEKGPRFVHTLNGTGVAVGRTLIAIMENYQQADGSIVVPDVLRPLMGKDVIGA